MKFNKMNSEIYNATSEIIDIGMIDIDFLKKEIKNCPNNRIRICAHRHSSDLLHEMLIVIKKGSYIRPHKHLNKSESFHIIEGKLDVVIFDDEGNIIEIINMGNPFSGNKFFYRLSGSYFHTLILKTDLVVFHEVTNGPFIKSDTVYAPWSPVQGNETLEQKFMNQLEKSIKQC